MSKSNNTTLIILAFFSIYVIWGSTYLLNKIAVAELPPFMLASVRFVVAGILILVLCKFIGISIGISKRQLLNSIIAGFLFLTFGNGVVVWALKYVDSGFAALEISAQPLLVLILMRIFVCMLSWGYGSLFVGKADLPKNYFVNTGYQMSMGGVMLLIASISFGETWTSPLKWSPSVQLTMLLLIVFGSIVAFTSFNYLLKVISPEKVATSTYVNPIIALILGWYFLNEQITLQSVMAAVILLTGVYFINTKRELPIFSRFPGRITSKQRKP